MTIIFTTPYLKLDSDNDTWSYRYLDGRGNVLATAVQVAGPEPPRGWLRRTFNSGTHARPRIVLRVDGPGGPLFFVDRAGMPPNPNFAPTLPCAVVAPDGRVLGWIMWDQRMRSQRSLRSEGNGFVFQLVDDQHRPLCTIIWEGIAITTSSVDEGEFVSTTASGGRYCDFTDTQGVAVARYDRGDGRYDEGALTIAHQLPQPLHSLVVAAPLGMSLLLLGLYEGS